MTNVSNKLFNEVKDRVVKLTFDNINDLKSVISDEVKEYVFGRNKNLLNVRNKNGFEKKSNSLYDYYILYNDNKTEVKGIFEVCTINPDAISVVFYEGKLMSIWNEESELFEVRPDLFSEKKYVIARYSDPDRGYGMSEILGYVSAKTKKEAREKFHGDDKYYGTGVWELNEVKDEINRRKEKYSRELKILEKIGE